MIKDVYLLVQGSTPIYQTPDGELWLDRLWAIDVRGHTAVIENLQIASPLHQVPEAGPDHVQVSQDPKLSAVTFIALPGQRSTFAAARELWRTTAALARAIKAAHWVHCGVVGWPYPLGWLACPLAKRFGKRTVVVVESAPWRASPGLSKGLKQRWRSALYEVAARRIVSACDVKIFTTRRYLDEFCGSHIANASVVEASWIDEKDIVAVPRLSPSRDASDGQVGRRPLRLAFFGRLSEDKGLLVLLDALSMGQLGGVEVSLDIYGDGPQKADVLARLEATSPRLNVRYQGTLAYGADFFARLRQYDYVVVPSLGDEQPRIVFDAYSQGVPVIASETPGLSQCVFDAETGHLFERGNAAALAQCIRDIASSQEGSLSTGYEAMQTRCIVLAREKTHAAMHQRRAELIATFSA